MLEYQRSHHVDPDISELCCNAFDYLLDERAKQRDMGKAQKVRNPELLTDKEFDKAYGVIVRNGIRLKSVENIRFPGDVAAAEGQSPRC